MSILLNGPGHDQPDSATTETHRPDPSSSLSPTLPDLPHLPPLTAPSPPPSLITSVSSLPSSSPASTLTPLHTNIHPDGTDTDSPHGTNGDGGTETLAFTDADGADDATQVKPLQTRSTVPPSPSPSLKVRFGDCPSRPPELQRRSSITLGVLARKSLLNGQAASEGAGGGPSSPGGGFSGYASAYGYGAGGKKDEIKTVYMTDAQWAEHLEKVRGTAPEPIDLGAVVSSSARNLWRKVRRNSSNSTTSPGPSPSTGLSLTASPGGSNAPVPPSPGGSVGGGSSPLRLRPFRQRAESAPDRVEAPLLAPAGWSGSENGSNPTADGAGAAMVVVSPMQEIAEEEAEHELDSGLVADADEESEEGEDEEGQVEAVTPGSPPPISGLQLLGVDDVPDIEDTEGGKAGAELTGSRGRSAVGSADKRDHGAVGLEEGAASTSSLPPTQTNGERADSTNGQRAVTSVPSVQGAPLVSPGSSTAAPVSILQNPLPPPTAPRSARSVGLTGSATSISRSPGPTSSRAKDAAILGFDDWRYKPKQNKLKEGAGRGGMVRRESEDGRSVGSGIVKQVPRLF